MGEKPRAVKCAVQKMHELAIPWSNEIHLEIISLHFTEQKPPLHRLLFFPSWRFTRSVFSHNLWRQESAEIIEFPDSDLGIKHRTTQATLLCSVTFLDYLQVN